MSEECVSDEEEAADDEGESTLSGDKGVDGEMSLMPLNAADMSPDSQHAHDPADPLKGQDDNCSTQVHLLTVYQGEYECCLFEMGDNYPDSFF